MTVIKIIAFPNTGSDVMSVSIDKLTIPLFYKDNKIFILPLCVVLLGASVVALESCALTEYRYKIEFKVI